jgi:hypothetical protein
MSFQNDLPVTCIDLFNRPVQVEKCGTTVRIQLVPKVNEELVNPQQIINMLFKSVRFAHLVR